LNQSHLSTNRAGCERPVYRADGAIIGKIAGQTLRKRASASRHQLRKPPAWCWDADALTTAQASGVTWCEIEDTGTGTVYRARLADFVDYGFDVNRGHGHQRGLTLKYWTIQQAGEPGQLELFR
jgi:hypothetical protein